MKMIPVFVSIFLFIINCGGSSFSPVLTRETVKRTLTNPPQHQPQLVTGTFYGCEHIPTDDPVRRRLLGFEKTGNSCSITISAGNKVQVSFLSGSFSVVGEQGVDSAIGDINNDQVLIVQYDNNGNTIDATQTAYDQNGTLNYGAFGEGEFIKSCHVGRKLPGQRVSPTECVKPAD